MILTTAMLASLCISAGNKKSSGVHSYRMCMSRCYATYLTCSSMCGGRRAYRPAKCAVIAGHTGQVNARENWRNVTRNARRCFHLTRTCSNGSCWCFVDACFDNLLLFSQRTKSNHQIDGNRGTTLLRSAHN